MLRPVSSHVPNVPVATFVSHALGRAPSQAVFPVVDRAGAVGGQMGDPAALHQPLENLRRAVAQQMGAVDQDHAGPRCRAPRDLGRALARSAAACASAAAAGGGVGIEQDIVGPGQAVALGEREDFELSGREVVVMSSSQNQRPDSGRRRRGSRG